MFRAEQLCDGSRGFGGTLNFSEDKPLAQILLIYLFIYYCFIIIIFYYYVCEVPWDEVRDEQSDSMFSEG